MFYKLLVADARVAQLVEQRTENPRVGGSIPSPSTITNPRFFWGFVVYKAQQSPSQKKAA